ncbi:MAG: phytanoyl-CoA dioxygenase family protein [SAR324 cluster bacterium]|nr:phytanoyl-CoA dioxygenase family protein [SAR324 cluster bacterium]
MGPILSETEVAAYQHDGQVTPEHYRMPDELLSAMRHSVKTVLERNPEHRPENLMNVHLESGPEGVKGAPAILEYAKHPPFLDMVEQVLGPDLILWGVALFSKPAATGLEVPWHQDAHYWPMRPRATCTLWIALDDATPENGCMRVIPGSHKNGLLGHRTRDDEGAALNQELSPDEYDVSLARDVVLRAGQVSLHDVFLVHGSCANTSGQPRTGLVYRYMPGTSHYDRSTPPVPGTKGTSRPNYADRPIFLLRGEDRTGRNDFQRGL